ncbi:CTSH isoform 4 [Pongo abelii]|uniref:CTSH isoform 4 n=1 Tax=Pongo abelii TaxID=9601 RepID=A0A2J8SKI0_PONAB|nr:CTSH isoform 4 [Pongo abelii]
MWAALPLLCAGACLLGSPVCGAAELSVNSLEKFHFKSWMSKKTKAHCVLVAESVGEHQCMCF